MRVWRVVRRFARVPTECLCWYDDELGVTLGPLRRLR